MKYKSDENIIKKIWKHGLLGSIEVLLVRFCRWINDMLYYLFSLLPVDKNRIVFESEGDLSDNAYALYENMINKGLLKIYNAAWLVDDIKKIEKTRYENTIFLEKNPRLIKVRRSYYLATCRWYIYDHCNLLEMLNKREDTTIVNLWHGCGFKGGKSGEVEIKSKPDYMIVTGRLFVDIQSAVFGYPKDKFLEFGYPRNDYLFKNFSIKQKCFKEKFKVQNKVILWMPTFRKSDNTLLNEEYFESQTGLPIIDTVEKLKQFNDFLAKENCVCIFKLHHLQAKLNVFKEKYSNILVVKDEDIKKAGIQLYEILPLTDCLISDYSSVATDYFLLNKPMLFTLDDYDKYRNSRGFAIEDPLKYFVGYHTKNIEEFYDGVYKMITDECIFKADRNKILSELHTYKDGHAADRILDFLEIS